MRNEKKILSLRSKRTLRDLDQQHEMARAELARALNLLQPAEVLDELAVWVRENRQALEDM
jgi:hypothetical protein